MSVWSLASSIAPASRETSSATSSAVRPLRDSRMAAEVSPVTGRTPPIEAGPARQPVVPTIADLKPPCVRRMSWPARPPLVCRE